MFNAQRDALVWSAGAPSGTITAGRDAAVLSLDNSQMIVHAGDDALASTFGDYHGSLVAGKDAAILSLGGVSAGTITAGGSALLWSLGDAIYQVRAEEYAGAIVWGNAAGPAVVNGPDGAFAWTSGDFNGFVESSQGHAVLIAFGNVGYGDVQAGKDGFVFTAGNFTGQVNADDDAGLIILGSVNAGVNAGADGFILSESDITGSINAGKDAYILAYGDVTGSYSGQRDAGAAAYGDLDISLSAGRDLFDAWSGGDLQGAYTAGRDIAEVMSYGEISASITSGRDITGVKAVGSIGGQITAVGDIGYVHSGDAVTASISAANTVTPIEYDADLAALVPPDLPDSIHAEIMAEVDAAYQALLTDKALIAADIAELFSDFADAKATALADLQATRGQALSDVTDAARLAKDSLQADLDASEAFLQAQRTARQMQLSQSQQETLDAQTSILNLIGSIEDARDMAYDVIIQSRLEKIQILEDLDDAFNLYVASLATIRQSALEQWEPTPFRPVELVIEHIMNSQPTTAGSLRAEMLPLNQRQAQAAANLVDFQSLLLDLMPGVGTAKGFNDAWSGQDTLTGQQLAWWERGLSAASALPLVGGMASSALESSLRAAKPLSSNADIAGDLVDTATSVGRRMDDNVGCGTSCTSMVTCFVAGTPTQVGQSDGGVWYAMSNGLVAGSVFAVLATQVIASYVRKQSKRKMLDEVCDQLFGSESEGNWWENDDE